MSPCLFYYMLLKIKNYIEIFMMKIPAVKSTLLFYDSEILMPNLMNKLKILYSKHATD